jgi:hypothetical protein
MDDILLTCQSVTFVDGYPVLRKVFRHMARTPRKFRLWIETRRAGVVYFRVSYSNGVHDLFEPVELMGPGSDVFSFDVPPGFEGGVQSAMIDSVSGELRATRNVHFGGMTWQGQ